MVSSTTMPNTTPKTIEIPASKSMPSQPSKLAAKRMGIKLGTKATMAILQLLTKNAIIKLINNNDNPRPFIKFSLTY